MDNPTYCGMVAIVGRPNVGKSTLLNRLMRRKISITSRKPQTTRTQILGIKTEADRQIVYVDTPGLHAKTSRVINRYMNRMARAALKEVQLILFVVEAAHWYEEDQWVLEQLKKIKVPIPIILVINKIDRLKNRKTLLPLMQALGDQFPFHALIPISAQKNEQIAELEHEIERHIPESPFYFPPEQTTNQTESFMAAEIVREKSMRLLGDEIPYALAVTVIFFKRQPKLIRISAVIWVEKAGQKKIVIGKMGERMKQIGTQARHELEKLWGRKVFLQLWVKVKSRWSDDVKLLKDVGLK